MAGLRLRKWAMVFTCAIVAHARALSAQEDERFPIINAAACLVNVDSARMHRVPVFLSGRMMNRADSAFSMQADLLAQDVATSLRALRGGSDSAVTNEDRHLAWSSVPTSIVVLAHSNGDMSAHPLFVGVGVDSSADLLLLQALDSARAHGGAVMLWPDGFAKDSVYARLDLAAGYAHASPIEERTISHEHRFVVFTLTEPEEDPALPVRNTPPPRYPPQNERTHYTGSVLMQFTVDTAGRAEPKSIRDLFPTGKPRLEGNDAEAYDGFVSTLTSWLRTVRFQPAHLGSCVRRQQVQWPFVFKFGRAQ